MTDVWRNVILFVVGGVFGSGSLWAFLEYRQRGKEVELSSAVSISELQKDLTDKLLELISRSEEYSDVRDGRIEVEIPENKLMQLYAHIEILQGDIRSCEDRLSRLENRPPRKINVEYIRPEPPNGVRVVLR